MTLKIGIILGSTRPGRNGEAVAKWVQSVAAKRTDAEYELVDLLDFDLSHLNEATPAAYGNYAGDHTKSWAAKVDSFDGYIFVTPEYNHSTTGALKTAIDFLYAEWGNKAAGIVSYGAVGGVRAAEHLRLILANLAIATVRSQVMLSLATDFENYSVFAPAESQQGALTAMLDETVSWAAALKTTRVEESEELAA